MTENTLPIPRPANTRPNVLLLERDMVNATLIFHIFRKHACNGLNAELVHVNNPQSAMAHIKQTQFALLIVGNEVHHSEGWGVMVNGLRASMNGHKVPMLSVSAKPKELLLTGLSDSDKDAFAGFVVLPYDMEEFAKTVRQHMHAQD